MLVCLVTGTRPQIIKSAPVMNAMEDAGIQYEFVHTGQHYDYDLAGTFIDGLNLKKPLNLEVGSGSYNYQVYETMQRLSVHLEKSNPDYLIVPGDTTSALAAAMVGFKMDIPVCHLESGLRRFDFRVQEEMNRRLIDHGSSALFAPTKTAVQNLEVEQVLGRIYHIGDTMYDVLKSHLPRFSKKDFRRKLLDNLSIESDGFAVLTIHRRENVDRPDTLSKIVSAINSLEFPIIFPMHPRTRKRMLEFSLELKESHVRVTHPLSYDEFLCLLASSKLVISDSGGIQKECYLLNVPLVSLQTRTEWVEAVEAGACSLTVLETDSIISKCQKMYGKKLSNDASVYGDGNAAKKIPAILESGEISLPTDRRINPAVDYFRDFL
ncbi:MAG: non-hydrolyzing UDP-N-acetylglucosamine 2-epimerase [Candidatus Thorarchaeota archaeon]